MSAQRSTIVGKNEKRARELARLDHTVAATVNAQKTNTLL